MGQTNSNPVRLYTRFILILKIIQYLGFFVVVLLGLMYLGFAQGLSPQGSLAPLALVFFVTSKHWLWDDLCCYSSTDSDR
jgi:hypothetical protein